MAVAPIFVPCATVNFRASYLSFSLAALLLACAALVLLSATLIRTDGRLIYGLDDVYIHLSFAKNLVVHGNWGLSPGQFDPSSSSPLYLLLLALGFLLSGVNAWLPLAIGILAGLGTLYATNRIAHRQGLPDAGRFTALMAMIFLVPLPFLMLQGMEHGLQVLIDVLFVYALVQRDRRHLFASPALLLLATMTTGIRYEGLFLIGMAALIMAEKKEWPKALAVLMAGLLPPLVFGLISRSKEAGFFPISVVSKRNLPGLIFPDILLWLGKGAGVLVEDVFMLCLLIVLACLILLYRRAGRSAAPGFEVSLVTAGALLLHVFFAQIGGIRYEAYLIALTVLAGITAAGDADLLADASRKTIQQALYAPQRAWRILFAPFRLSVRAMGLRNTLIVATCALLLPLLVRSGFFLWYYPRAVQNIYQQQYQMARFMQQYYPTSAIAANDIGAITFFSEMRLTDLMGIGDYEVFVLRQKKQLHATAVAGISARRGVRLAMIYDSWVSHFVPPEWICVATWTIPDNFICGDAEVGIYAADDASAATLQQQIRDFSATLPPGVIVRYEPL